MPIITLPPSASGQRLSDCLASSGVSLSAPCGGRGTCGKCRVQVVSGVFLSRATGEPLTPDADGYILACQAIIPDGGSCVSVPENSGDGLTLSSFEAARAPGAHAAPREASDVTDGFALDIGTTTLAAARVDARSGKVTATASCLNPQQSFGADVITRIGACREGHLSEMQSLLLSSVRGLIGKLFPELSEDTPAARLPRMAVAGNATMLHIFAGVSPEGMGTYPFTPTFTDARRMTGSELSLPVSGVILLPSVSAFVGGDITAGLPTCGLGASPVPTPPLADGNRLISASTAAGPALEGANISCGMGGVSGAVSRVSPGVLPGTLVYQTVNDAPARGLCGCGLIDFCARLLDLCLLDETGCLDDDPAPLVGAHRTSAGLSPEAETPVALTQKDIREVQLAKSAIRAGLEALLDAAGLDVPTFMAKSGRVCIAGGLGYYLDPMSAARIGLLPPAFLSRPGCVTAVGNTALAGAVAALSDPSACDSLASLAQKATSIELNTSAIFNDGFIEYMMFPEKKRKGGHDHDH